MPPVIVCVRKEQSMEPIRFDANCSMSSTESSSVVSAPRRVAAPRGPDVPWPRRDQARLEAGPFARVGGRLGRLAPLWTRRTLADRRLAVLLAELTDEPTAPTPAVVARALVRCQGDPAMLRALARTIWSLSPDLATAAHDRESGRQAS
jgi:hypothetical protein